MKKFFPSFLLFLFTVNAVLAQNEHSTKIYFSNALQYHLPTYEAKAKAAYRYRDFERGSELFDSLVNNCLRYTYMDNFKFYRHKKKPLYLYDLKKPVYLITYASWRVPEKGEIPAINELAKKYKGQIKFMVLFWDTDDVAKKMSREFNKNVSIVYIDEAQNSDPFAIKNLKHSLGLPTCFLISERKQIMDIRRTIFLPYNATEQESFDRNYEDMEEGISSHLNKNVWNEEVVADFIQKGK